MPTFLPCRRSITRDGRSNRAENNAVCYLIERDSTRSSTNTCLRLGLNSVASLHWKRKIEMRRLPFSSCRLSLGEFCAICGSCLFLSTLFPASAASVAQELPPNEKPPTGQLLQQQEELQLRKNVVPDVEDDHSADDLHLPLSFEQALEKVREKSLVRAGMMFYLWDALFEELRDVAGAIVEVGVWKGGMSMLLAYAELSKIAISKKKIAMADPPPPLRPGDELTEQQNINVEPDEIHTTRTTRDLYLYDTFEGMPIELDATDVSAYVVKTYEKIKRTKATEEGEREFLESTGKMYHDGERIRWNYGSLDMVKQNLHSTGYSKSRLHFVKGRVEDTLQVAENLPKKIALLRLDTDLYSSTKIELRKLYPLLQPGGVLQVDDYCAWAGARRAVNEFLLRGLDWWDSDRTTTSEEDAAVNDHAHVEDDQQFGFHQLRSKTLSVKDFGAIAELDIVGTTASMLNGPLCFTAVKRRKPITDLEALRRLRYVVLRNDVQMIQQFWSNPENNHTLRDVSGAFGRVGAGVGRTRRSRKGVQSTRSSSRSSSLNQDAADGQKSAEFVQVVPEAERRSVEQNDDPAFFPVAVCLAGLARNFASPVVQESLKQNVFTPLVESETWSPYLFLRLGIATEDRKFSGHSPKNITTEYTEVKEAAKSLIQSFDHEHTPDTQHQQQHAEGDHVGENEHQHSCRKEKVKKLTVASKKFIVQSADSTRVVKWNKQCAPPYFWSEINYRMPRWYLQWHRVLSCWQDVLEWEMKENAKSCGTSDMKDSTSGRRGPVVMTRRGQRQFEFQYFLRLRPEMIYFSPLRLDRLFVTPAGAASSVVQPGAARATARQSEIVKSPKPPSRVVVPSAGLLGNAIDVFAACSGRHACERYFTMLEHSYHTCRGDWESYLGHPPGTDDGALLLRDRLRHFGVEIRSENFGWVVIRRGEEAETVCGKFKLIPMKVENKEEGLYSKRCTCGPSLGIKNVEEEDPSSVSCPHLCNRWHETCLRVVTAELELHSTGDGVENPSGSDPQNKDDRGAGAGFSNLDLHKWYQTQLRSGRYNSALLHGSAVARGRVVAIGRTE